MCVRSPLMRHDRPLKEVVPEAARLTGRLPEAQQEFTLGALLELAYHAYHTVDEDVRMSYSSC